jgi:nucleotide-binding universal stress UspA family protein
MTVLDKTFILACIDDSEMSDSVIEYAIWLAKNSQLPIKFLHTIEHTHHSEHIHHEGTITPNMTEKLLNELSDEERIESKRLIADGKTILNKATEKAKQAGLTDTIAKQRHGTLSEALQDLEVEIEIMVLGLKGEERQSDTKGLSSQLEQAIRVINKPVLVVKKSFAIPRNLLLAYNGSPTSKKAIEIINKDMFSTQLLNIHIMNVDKNLDTAKRLANEVETALLPLKCALKTEAMTGDPVQVFTEYQQQHNIDLTLMGSFSHGKIHGFMFGSFTTQMLRNGSSNFLLLR